MNLHLSEVLSDLVEPLVDKYQGGRECISTEDMIAKFVNLNETNCGWTRWSWYEGLRYEDYMGCGTCSGEWTRIMDETDPELCQCGGVAPSGILRVTARWLKWYRRTRWEKTMGWDTQDEERILLSTEALPEDIQDYQIPMVIVGFDVVSLYPNLDTSKVGNRVKQALLESTISWEGVNWTEAVRYIALNWTEERCRSSKLRRVLPWRRKNQGCRPGVRGIGPKGPEVGDQEQWVFPRITLTAEDKLEILGTVLDIATTALFSHHYYSFGGSKYKQKDGGPIGLRGTCAIARLMMQIFDVKWEGTLKDLCIKIWLNCRYMDDGRTAMPPLKPGWRWMEGSLKFCTKWEREDQELSSLEITRRVILGTLNMVEDYLSFTTETEEDFADRWLPTLDMKLRVSGSNLVLHGFYEKPTNSNVTVQRRTAMGEDAKIQILSNDLVRRLRNSSEELGKGAKVEIVDNYAQKLVNSGFRGEQLRRIVTNGIKGYESKLRRCREQGWRLHRSSTDSQGERIRRKLLGKSNWFRKRRKIVKEDEQKATRRSFGGNKYRRELPVKTVLFVEQSPMGELAKKLKDTLRGMEQTLGFRVKVVERTGRSMGSKFPLNSLWKGAKCGRGDCTTCEQGGEEELPDCSKVNLVYENLCTVCNPGASKKGELGAVRTDIPTTYIGETSRSVYERSREHWEGAKKGSMKNHMIKHQVLEHGGEQKPEFFMKIRGFYKTALARQVAEAVMIRRRGGEGAILNSKGEFSRSYIPRLQVVEEEAVENNGDREQTAKQLREQDRDWETTRARELGRNAILGPMSSPRKRSNDEGGGEHRGNKRRRKKLKHKLVEEGWGELPLPKHQGANQGTPQKLEMELKLQHGEPVGGEQDKETSIEGEQENIEKTGSRIPGEQSLVQLRMTGFLNPAPPAKQGWPTTDDRAACVKDEDPAATRSSSRGSPSKEGGVVIYLDREDDSHFGISSDEALLDSGHSSGGKQTSILPEKDDCVSMNVGGISPKDDDDYLSGVHTVTSVGSGMKPGPPVRKLDQVLGAVCDSGTDDEKIIGDVETGCTFKRGGLCNIHNVRGTRVEDRVSVWTKKKNGMFGWTKRTKVRYVCQNDGVAKPVRLESQDSRVAKSNDEIRDTGPEKQTRQDAALGGISDKDGILSRVCGADYRQAGSRLRESSVIRRKRKDPE